MRKKVLVGCLTIVASFLLVGKTAHADSTDYFKFGGEIYFGEHFSYDFSKTTYENIFDKNSEEEKLFEKYGIFDKQTALRNTSVSHSADFELYSLQGIENFKNLTYIGPGEYTRITDLHYLSDLTKLKNVCISTEVPISDLTPLRNLTNMEELVIIFR